MPKIEKPEGFNILPKLQSNFTIVDFSIKREEIHYNLYEQYMKEENKEADKGADKETNAKQDIDAAEENKHKLLEMSEISLLIDTYDDIFSDFDPRPYSRKPYLTIFCLRLKKQAEAHLQERLN